jgi:hypothetical protein
VVAATRARIAQGGSSTVWHCCTAHQHPELQRCCELCDGCPALCWQGQLVLTALQGGGHLQPVVAADGLLDLRARIFLVLQCLCGTRTDRGACGESGRFPAAPHLAPCVILEGFLVCLCRMRVGGGEAAGGLRRCLCRRRGSERRARVQRPAEGQHQAPCSPPTRRAGFALCASHVLPCCALSPTVSPLPSRRAVKRQQLRQPGS